MFENKFGKTQAYFCKQSYSTFWDLIRANRRKTFWDETFEISENHKKGSKIAFRDLVFTEKEPPAYSAQSSTLRVLFFLEENIAVRPLFYMKHSKENIKTLQNTRNNTQLHEIYNNNLTLAYTRQWGIFCLLIGLFF